MGLNAGGVGRAGGHTTTTIERNAVGTAPGVACTTDYRHGGTRLPRRRTPPRIARRPPRRAAAASIHSLRTQLFIGHDGRAMPPRERATRARPRARTSGRPTSTPTAHPLPT